jgi:FKBP-type peptidyl-prolyl cis-trans isomerase FklB
MFKNNTMSFETQEEKFSYALGLSMASNLLQSRIKSIEFDAMFAAIKDVMEGRKPLIPPHDANKVIEEFFIHQQNVLGAENSREGDLFLSQNRSKDGVVELESGLQYKIILQGNGPKPKISDKVKCHYHGTLINGTVFDSSIARKEPAIFPVNGVIRGWIEALQLMSIGSKWQLFIPPHLAYGDHGTGGPIGPKMTLIFEVELLEIV